MESRDGRVGQATSGRRLHNNSRLDPTTHTLLCRNWQRGICDKGNSCIFRHSNDTSAGVRGDSRSAAVSSRSDSIGRTRNSTAPLQPEPGSMGPCAQFRKRQRCSFGDSCKFSHDPNIRSDPTQMERGQPLDDLKTLLRLFTRAKQFASIMQFEKFLESSLKALELADKALQSKAIMILSESENAGREVVRYVAEAMGRKLPPFQDLEFDKHIAPFMKFLVHDIFTTTCVEKNLLYLIKALYGDGERADRLLTRIIDMLGSITESDNADATATRAQEHCLLVCTLLHHVIRYNADAMSQDGLRIHHARLLVLSDNVQPIQSVTRRIKNSLSESAAYLFPTLTKPISEPAHTTPSFTPFNQETQIDFFIDFPGRLSRSQPRHDNDSHLLPEIRILPTKKEFQSNRPEYLPINDIRASHFMEGPARLFDIHFRLLREDMIGPMRTAVNAILSHLQTPSPDPQILSRFENNRNPALSSTRIYSNVSVDSAQFDRKGLVFRLRFQQPARFRGLSTTQRVAHWKTIRSLEAHSLLCLVSNRLDLQCFFTVVKKDEKALGNDRDWCSIDVVLAEGDDSTREKLLHLLTAKKKKADILILVEFTGVLLTSYKTILENLQTRFQHPYLPFANLLCPAPSDLKPFDRLFNTVKIQSPLYAMPDGFEYDLTPLKKASASPDQLLLSPDASPDDEELLAKLENETTLDAGQCKGLIVGLTRELALIQGLHIVQSFANVKGRLELAKHILEWNL